MAKFKVGDRVVFTGFKDEKEGDFGHPPNVGELGTVVNVNYDAFEDGLQPYFVRFDSGASNGLGDGWWVYEDEINLASTVRRIVVAEVEGLRFERDGDAVLLFIDGECYAQITVDQLRDVIQVLEV